MDFNRLKEYCLSKKGAYEDFPFDSSTLVFKVGGKMFGLTSIGKTPLSVNLKCDPILCEALREEYQAVKPGYHMNKRHWNTVMIDGSIPNEKVQWMIDISYNLVFNGLTRADRDKIIKNNI